MDEATRKLFGRTLRQLRHDANLSQPQLARQIPVSQATLSRYESGKQAVDQAIAARLDDLLDAGGALRIIPESYRSPIGGDHAWRPRSDAQLAGMLAEDAPAGHVEESIRRRAWLGFTGSAIAGTLLSSTEHTRRSVDAALRMPASALDVDEWEGVAHNYAALLGKSPNLELLPQMLADFDELRVRIESAGELLLKGLLRVAGLLGLLIAVSLLCVGKKLEANRYWRTSQRAADAIGDRQLGSLIRGRRAVYGLYMGTGNRASLTLADTALSLADGRPSAGRASARAAQAQMLAQIGSISAAQDALVQLQNDFERLPDAVLSDSTQWGWSEQRLRFVQSFVHSYAGNINAALDAQESALALYPHASYRGSAQIHFHRGIAMAAAGSQVEGAEYILKTFGELSPHLRVDQMIYQPATLALEAITDPMMKASAINRVKELLASGPESL